MSHLFSKLESAHIDFIKQQKIFFVGTAPHSGRISVSPKGYDSLKIMSESRLIWLNLTGSGNETAAHLQDDSRMTLMFCSFDEKPLVLRVYGQAKLIQHYDDAFNQYAELFSNDLLGKRQIIILDIESVQTSCGLSIPFYDYKGERPHLKQWAKNKGEEGIYQYWKQKNQHSIDGKDTKTILDKDHE